MSRMTTAELVCPECRHTQDATVWSSINVTVDPSLRAMLFDGKINWFKCESCGEEALIEVPLLYHDMERAFSVQYYPPETIDDDDFINTFERQYPATIKDISQTIGEHLVRPHLVFVFKDVLYCVLFYERLLDASEYRD